MQTRTNQYLCEACQGRLLRGAPAGVVHRLCTDSRSVKCGDLFLAIAGDRFDGHDFLNQAVEKGASTLVVQEGRHTAFAGSCAVIAVDDTRKALGRLGARYRKDFDPLMIVVGGSNGKTSTKGLIASLLGTAMPTLASEASFNNDIGVPTTLLNLEPEHRVAILEAGTNHPGELAPLVELIQPRFGVITSIGREHLQFFGSMERVVEEESALARALPADGRLFLNVDSEWSAQIAASTRATVVKAGTSAAAEWRGKAFRVGRSGTGFRLDSPRVELSGHYRVPLLGRHQAINAILAIAIAAELGLSREQIQAGLDQCRPAKMRLQLWDWNGVQVLDDAYNANTDSVRAALLTLKELPCQGRRVAVLGDMAELGEHSEAAHEEVGRTAAEEGVEQLFAVGTMAPIVGRAARAAGLNRVMEFPDVNSAVGAVKGFVRSGDVMLLKASRSSRLERLGELLTNPERAGGVS
jgi:UDP-N-acetylmuramoyl-tripeptide--D-alanyl-D-alanine ligase